MKYNYKPIHVYNCLINIYKYFASLTRRSFNVVTIAAKQFSAFLLVFLIFSIRFGWIILLLIISEILVTFNLIPSYSRHYNLIKSRIRHWHMNSIFNLGLLVLSIIAGPYLLERSLYYFIFITKWIVTFLRIYTIQTLRFGWIILFLIISEILVDFNLIPSYSRHYNLIKFRIQYWYMDSIFNLGLLVFSIIAGPYLLETFLYYFIIITKWIVIFLSIYTIHTLRFSWIILPIIITEAITKSGNYSNYIARYQSIKRSLSYWCNIKSVKHGILIFSITFGPYVIETFLYYSFVIIKSILLILFSPVIFIIRFGWLLLFIVICEKLKNTDDFPNFSRKYRSIKQKLDLWYCENRFNYVVLMFSIIFGPFIIETFLYYSFVIIKSVLFILFSPVIFIIRFGWLILLIIISENLINPNDYPNFSRKYRSIKQKLDLWRSKNYFNDILFIFSIVTGPFLIETFLYYLLLIIKLTFLFSYPSIIFIIRFGWISLLIIINEILAKSGNNPKFSAQYESIQRIVHIWCINNK